MAMVEFRSFAGGGLKLPAQVDLGIIRAGEVTRGSISLANKRWFRNLEIERVRASCGCTNVVWPQVLGPRGDGEILFEIDPGLYRSEVATTLWVFTTGDDTPATMELHAVVEPPFSGWPKLAVAQLSSDGDWLQIEIASESASGITEVACLSEQGAVVEAILDAIAGHVRVTPFAPAETGAVNLVVRIGNDTWQGPIRVDNLD